MLWCLPSTTPTVLLQVQAQELRDWDPLHTAPIDVEWLRVLSALPEVHGDLFSFCGV